MRIAFFSNFLNHHQLPFCLNLYQELGDDFHFIATTPLHEEQLALGYPDLNREYPFVIRTYEDEAQKDAALALAENADVVIIGSAPKTFIKQRLKAQKLTFLYSERLYKTGFKFWKLPAYLWFFHRTYGHYKNFYLLCASAYTAGDFAKTFTFLNKAYKWGYFPEVKRYEHIQKLINCKQINSIMWAGRFIDWKHPEYVIEVARRLKADGYQFQINMLGNGTMHDTIANMIKENRLADQVHLLGAMPPEEVRNHMERASIYLFTSDRNEGWGAVLNEAMNSGCAVVACNAIGSVPFLLKNKENGLIYKSGNVDALYEKVRWLMDHPESCKKMGQHAYETMTELWNADVATSRLLSLCRALLLGEKCPHLYESGPCSEALILHDHSYTDQI